MTKRKKKSLLYRKRKFLGQGWAEMGGTAGGPELSMSTPDSIRAGNRSSEPIPVGTVAVTAQAVLPPFSLKFLSQDVRPVRFSKPPPETRGFSDA